MRLGFRSFGFIVLGVFLCFYLLFLDFMELEKLLNARYSTLFFTGLLSSVITAVVFRFAKNKAKSKNQLRFFKEGAPSKEEITLIHISQIPPFLDKPFLKKVFFLEKIKGARVALSANTDQKALEVPLWLRQSLLFCSILLLSIICVNERTLSLFHNLKNTFDPNPAEYCPENFEAEIKEDLAIEVSPACELLFRAYKLGYADSLGDCIKDDDKDPFKMEVCRLRQHDEPFLHYTYRKLKTFFSSKKKYATIDQLQKEAEKWDLQLKSLKDYFSFAALTMTASKRATHHIFTNLENPKGAFIGYLNGILNKGGCIKEFADMERQLEIDPLDEKKGAKKMHYSYGQLLFHAGYKKAVGYCREYVVHWGLSQASCQKMAENPEGFLQSIGAYEDVKTVIDRYGLEKRLSSLEKKLLEIDNPKEKETKENKSFQKAIENHKKMGLKQAISFQCLFEKEAEPRKMTYKADLFGQSFTINEHSYRPPKTDSHEKIPTRRLKDLSELLSPGFKYSGFTSNQKITASTAKEIKAHFAKNDKFMLTKLETLLDADILLGHKWLHDREDLLEVYPWYYHLYHFVDMFRRDYKGKRGRL